MKPLFYERVLMIEHEKCLASNYCDYLNSVY